MSYAYYHSVNIYYNKVDTFYNFTPWFSGISRTYVQRTIVRKHFLIVNQLYFELLYEICLQIDNMQ